MAKEKKSKKKPPVKPRKENDEKAQTKRQSK